MKVILVENVPALGQIGEVVNVAPGYARNYLLPKGIVMEATGKNVRELDHKKRMLAVKRDKVRQQMLSLAEKLNQVRITLRRKVAEEDKLYGSVTSSDIISALQAQGFEELGRRNIQMDQPIKQLGEFPVPIRVDSEITANVTVVVDKEE